MTDWFLVLAWGAIVGLIYGWLSARFAMKKTGTFETLVSLIFIVITIYLVISAFSLSLGTGIAFLVITFIFAFIANMRTNLRHEKKQSLTSLNKNTDNSSYDKYSITLVKASVEATKRIGASLNLQSDKYVDRIMYEMIAYSLFVTSLHFQREKMSKRNVDSNTEALVDSISSYVAKIFEHSKPNEHKLLVASMQHFYQKHVDMSSGGGEMLQTIAKTIMTEYSTEKSKDFSTMAEVVDILGDLGVELNKTGFSKSLS